jgi:hypothetical protein
VPLRERLRLLAPQRLTAAQWQQRHRFVLSVLLVPLVPLVWFLGRGVLPIDLATTYLILVLLQAMLALTPRIAPTVRQVFAAGALLTASSVLVESSARIPAAHLVFALVLCTLTLYQDAPTYIGGVGYVALYYLGLGWLDPGFIYPPTMDSSSAISWSLTFFFVAFGTSLIGVLGWVLNSRSMRESEALKVALAEAGLRERQARELNDTVVQHLATAVYASEEGDTETSAAAAREGLAAARRLVASLRAPSWLRDQVLLRDTASQDVPGRSIDVPAPPVSPESSEGSGS